MSATYAWETIRKGAWSRARYWDDPAAPRPDAYMIWADATGFVDIAPRPGDVDRVPILLELKEGRTARAWARKVKRLRYVEVPRAYQNPPAELKATRHCTARVGREFFAQLGAEPLLRDWIERFEVGLPASNPAPQPALDRLPAPRRSASGDDEGTPERAVVIATIDDNLAFAHARFRERDGMRTRVEFFWDQGVDAAHRPETFGYGSELSRAAIDACMAAASTGGHIDEDEVYRLAGYAGASRRLAHGTHTMDLAGGEDPWKLEEDASRHIWVQFPARDNWGSAPLGAHVLDGLRYIVDRADSLARSRWADARARPPIVVSLPHANLGGPHDGSTLLEEAMDELIALRSDRATDSTSDPGFLDIVLPAGNNHLSRCHAHFDLPATGSEELEWRILPDDATPNFLEIWLADERDARDVRIHVATPDGEACLGSPAEGFKVGDVMALKRGNSAIACTVAFLPRPGNADGAMAFVAVGPTSTHRRPAGGTSAPAGTWKVRLENARTKGRKIHVEAWIQRDDPVLGAPRYGRQSHFEDARYVRFEPGSGRLNQADDARGPANVKRSGAINGIATGRRTVVVGGVLDDNGRASAYSGRAHATAVADDPIPDVAAVSDASWNRRGVVAAGIRSGAVFSMDGTSVAAAQVARVISDRRLKLLKQPTAPRTGRVGAGQSHGKIRARSVAKEQEENQRPKGWDEDVDSTRSGVGRIVVRRREPVP